MNTTPATPTQAADSAATLANGLQWTPSLHTGDGRMDGTHEEFVTMLNTLLATPIWEGGKASIAWPIGAGMILLFWLMTGLYIRRANGEFDDINSEIIKEAIE